MKKINLLNKKILYIGRVDFFYDQLLIKKLEELGAHVDSFGLHIKSPYSKFATKFKIVDFEAYKEAYYNSVLLKKGFDLILVRQGDQIKPELYERLRIINPNAKFINFHWDSLKPGAGYNYRPIIRYFDSVYSFDYKDCSMHKEISYLPLFYVDDYAEFREKNTIDQYEFDILFVGSWRNKERYDLIKLTEKLAKQNQMKFYYYLYFSFKSQIELFKKGIIAKKSTSRLLSTKEILQFFSISNTVIDFPSSFQTGLTMRTFETLAAGKKLITTNKNIINEPFYDPQYINLVDIDNFKLDVDFIKNKPATSITEILKNYSLESYIYKLLQN